MEAEVGSGSQSDQSTKESFREALKLTKPKKNKKKMKMTKMKKEKKDIDYKDVLNTKESSSRGNSNGKSGGNSKLKLFRLWLTCNTKFIVN